MVLFRCVTLVFAVMITASVQQANALEPVQRPNIIYIMADDLGYGDLGCYGQRQITTPHIDNLAAEGLKFTDHYSGHTVCRPSRLVLLTGLHSGHTAISANDQYVLDGSTQTVTALLHRAGYVTGGVGKWALGKAGSSGAPSRQGFDSWFGYLDQGDAHNYFPEYLWDNEQKIEMRGNKVGAKKRVSIERETYSHDLMTNAALTFIRTNAEKPFFLQAHYTIPHANNEGGRATGDGLEVPDHEAYESRDWPAPEKGFAAMISRLDRDVGRIVQLVKDLGIERKTIVFFTSDNGPHQEGGHKLAFFDSNGPLRGYKRDLYEGGIRVPMIAWGPGQIERGTASNHPSAFWDFLPTACELAGVKIPKPVDGISYAPTLFGRTQTEHKYLYWQYRGKIAIRMGSFKVVRPGKDGPFELYDLSKDIGETDDISSSYPELIRQANQIIGSL